MEQMKLFKIPEKELINPVTNKALTCRSCTHRYKHEYGKMFYCRKRKQKGTAYGDKKIKAGDSACILHTPCK